ncbi:uncharacterized protein LOC143188352 [Calliopsis andreniformis]|uniref:uncharacterized protein LOC143188352 n=1 Tax=Calliopsis andreniformis TaxID=337506 RepID=UPI003FCDAEE4
MRSSRSPKVIREAQLADDSEDYEGVTTVAAAEAEAKGKNVQQDTKATTPYSNQTIDKISGATAIRISLKTAGVILLSTILFTCCCTLFVRNKLMKLFNKIRGKKKKGKLIPIIAEDADVSKSYYIRKPRVKRKRAPSYEVVHAATQNTIPVELPEPEEPAPTGCYRCYKKKRKKSTKRQRR